MNHPFKLAALTLAIAHTAFADEIPTYTGEEIVVTATRTPQSIKSLLNDVTLITQADIAKAGQSTLVELLQTQPGIEITSNGGMGTTTSVYIRGANSNHTLVLIDGLRMNSATSGNAAFENIPLSQIDHIEILRGPASSLYGADAIGGVIQIFTKTGEGAPKFNFAAGAGSDNLQSVNAGFRGQHNDTHFSLQAGYLSTDGFSAIGTPASSSYNPDPDGYHNTNFSARIAQTISPLHEVGLTALKSNGATQYDSKSTSPPSPASFNFHNEQFLSAYNLYSKNRFLPNWQSQLNIGVSTDELKTYAATTAPTTIQTDQTQFGWQNNISTRLGAILLGAERLEQKGSSDTKYSVKQRTINSYLAGYQGQFEKHSAQFNIRNDDNSEFGNHNTGALSYGYQMTSQWRASASVGNAFKAPTFNDLYYPNYGNPDLKPEQALNREVGVHFDAGVHHVGVVYFDNRVTDLIAYSTAAQKAININQASLTGTTLSYHGVVSDYRVRANLDLQQPEDSNTGLLLARRAQQHFTLAVNKKIHAWEIGGEMTVSGARYDDTANTVKLGGYTLFNLTAGYQINPEWSVRGRANNVFDKQYELARYYNTPGANMFVGVQYQPR